MKTCCFTKLLSAILVLAMLIQIIPIQSFAASSGSSVVEVEAGQPAVTVLGEVESLREEDAKHFRLSDGSFIAVSYGMPVHYEGEDGSWLDIDNTITLNNNTSTYQLNRTDAMISFSNALTNGTVLTTSVDGKSITMSLLDTSQAVMMIAGEDSEIMGENPVEKMDVSETVPEDTVSVPVSTEPVEETVPVTVPEETEAETVHEETVAEENIEDTTDETAAETAAAEPVQVEDDGTVSEIIEESIDTPAETMPQETIVENTEPVIEETLPTTIPEETLEPTVPEETIMLAVPEENAAATVTEETFPETTDPDATNTDDINTNTERNLTTPGEITFDRDATGEITVETPIMLSLQEKYSWDMEDIIPDTLQSSLLYEDVFPDVDLLYTAFGHNIKEQIIVNSAQDAYRYDFLLALDGLTAIFNEDGSVSFIDADQNQVYSIPVPYMEDEAGVLSSEVTYNLNDTAQGLILTVEASAEWINAEDREFPVKIDPSFVISSGSALDDIYSAYTMESAPNDPTLGRQYLYVGAQPNSTANDGRYRTFMHFNDMPTIPEGSDVVEAQLSMYQQLYNHRNCTSFPIGVYEVTTSLPSVYSNYFDWFSTMTWQTNMPSYNTSNAIDYVMVDSIKCYRQWNITELVKKWYVEGTSNSTCALVMMNEDEIDTYTYFASATFLAYASSIPPVLIVSYRNKTGMEPYYTYAALGAASAGTAYIADATGQLKVSKELIRYASATNPFSLNLVYNSDYFALSSNDAYQPPSKLGLNMYLGSGWTLNYIQKVSSVTHGSLHYLEYTDGDGTIHYFMQDPTPVDPDYPYYDEDGLGLKMKVNNTNNYTMADDHGNVWIFTNNYLTSVQDSDGNKININYSNGRLLSITQVNKGQSAIEVASFTYESNKLISVKDAAGNIITLDCPGTKLTSIQKNANTIASYSYDGYRLTKMTDIESSYALSFTYSNGKISSYKEMGGTSTGATVAVTYPSHSKTTYRDYGSDRTANTSDDILTHYLFDYAGRTANAYTTDNAGNVQAATNAVYSANTGTAKTNNRTLRAASIGIAAQQLLRNTSMESTANAWTFSGTSRATTKPRTGSYSVKGTLSGVGTQYAQRSSESLTANTTYTLSAYINTSSATNFEGTGVYLKVSDGTNSWTSYPINYATASVVDGGWLRVSVTFKAKTTGAHTVSVYNDGVSQFYADDFQLEKGDAPSNYNLVENGNMQISNYGWTMGTNASYSSARGAVSSTKSLLISSAPEIQTSNAYQDIALKLPGSQTYVLSGWVYANAVPDDDLNTASDISSRTKECGLRAVITYSDNSTETHYAPFNSDLSESWQFVSLTIVPEKPSTIVSTIRVFCAYEGNANTAYFDDISLLRETAQTMSYDENGNLKSVESSGLDKDTNTYANGNLIQTVTGGNGTYTYSYDTANPHRLTSVTNGLITQSMGYDAAGNVTSSTLSGSGAYTMTTSAVYTGNKNRLLSVTDATGATTTYGYGTDRNKVWGLPSSVTDPAGTITRMEYDDSGRTTQTSIASTAKLEYNYGNGNLTALRRTDSSANKRQDYNFSYDAFGNMTAAKVGTVTLASYSYAPGNGQLTTQTWGNGDTLSYTYDNLGRTKTAAYSDGRTLTYNYSGDGTISSVQETQDGKTATYIYNYDTIGRLVSMQKLVDGEMSLLVGNRYNSKNQLTRSSWRVGSAVFSQSYTYNSSDGSINTVTMPDKYVLTMSYDSLRRLSTITGKYTDSQTGVVKDSPTNKRYLYRTFEDNTTTSQVTSLRYSELNQAFQYSYDTLGNIATYAAPGKAVVTYTYDKQGQLLSATGGSNAYSYTYDTVGNILTATKNGETHTYTYSTYDWKDKLIAYDGLAIAYDAIGNPTSYYNGTRWNMTWENGRELATATSGNTSLAFTYDGNGIRTSKTVNGVEHKYYYSGGKLLRETYGNNILDFAYNPDGTLYSFRYNQTYYYYVTNLQGDVIALVNANGAEVASYEYDPYGNILSEEEIPANSIAAINPMRYRGYYYDTESGLYYLQSRYYDPTTGRFINADAFASTGQGILGNNMFAYCNNSPVIYADWTGTTRYLTHVFCENSGGRIEEYGQATAITVSIYGNAIYIDAYITFHGDVSAEFLIAGIENYWEGSYSNAEVCYDVYVTIHQGKNTNGHTIHVFTSQSKGRSWAYVNRFQWEMSKESFVRIYEKYYQTTTCDWTMAHEFGHCLGIGDYYTTKGLPGYDNTFVSIMHKPGQHASFSDIQKVICAFKDNYWQSW